MPKLTPNTVSVEDKNLEDSKDAIIKQLMEQVAELKNAISEITSKQENVDNYNSTTSNEPSPNKQIRIVSLCYGPLNLSTEPFGRGKLITFSKYGESKTILYSTLIDIVNNNRKFSENGSFYILDKDAVYYLGLSDFYKNILPKDIMDNIYDYSPSEITDLLNNATDEQKEVLIRNTIDKIYNNTNVDLNKCDVIGKVCGVDIMSKVNEMREINEALKSK